MTRKPSYEELENRIRQLEAEHSRYDQVEAQLKRSLRFTESLLAALPTPVFFKDAQGRYLGCNPAFSEMMGLTSEQMRGKTVQELWPHEQADVYHRRDLELMHERGRQVYEFEVKDKDGNTRPVIFCKRVFEDEHGNVAGLVGGIVDITELKQAEQELRTLFSLSLDMLCIADIHTATFVKVNPAFMATLGYSEEELLGRPFIDFIHPEDVLPTQQVIAENLQQGKKVLNFRNRYRHKDGTYRWLNWVSHPLPDIGLTYAVAHDSTDEIQATETLRSQRDLLNSMFDNLLLGITVWDADGRLLMINKEFTALTGYDQEDIRDLGDWFPRAYPDPEYRRHVLADWNAAKQTTHAVREFKVACKTGTVKHIEFRGAFLPDGRALVTMADITEREHAREENLKRQKFLESVLYHAPDAIVTLDSQHRVIDWNRGAVKMFGYEPEETIGIHLDDLVARGEHQKEAGSKTRQILSGRRVEAFETVRYRKDGTPLRVIAAGSPIMVDDVLTGVVAVYTDITDRVTTEEALRESEEKYRTLVEQSPLGIALIGKDGRYRYINPQFQAMLGYTIEDIPDGATWFRKAFPEKPSRDKVIQTWIDDKKQAPVGQARERDFTVTCKDGSRKEIHFRPVTLENLDQFVIYEDFTEKTNLERQFQQAQKFEAIGTLAGGIAHDFNNLLMGIHGHTSLMKVDLVPSHPHVEHIEAVEDYVRSAASLTKQLLGFARGGKYEVKSIDINALLTDSAIMFGRTKKEIRIHTKTYPRPLVADVDRGQIEQVFLNLFVNAWQAMPEGGDLFLETRLVVVDAEAASTRQLAPGAYVQVSVTDTGIGMDENIRLRIFDPFFTTKEKGRGTGLGLASAYGIINNHNGLITVSSEKGYGATFNIFLPQSTSEASDEMPMEGLLIKGSGTILLVDDEEMILSVGRAMLEKLGYRVLTANDGGEAVEVLRKRGEEIDLVILDLIMPGMDGVKTFDRIREIRPRTRVLLSSGYAIGGQADEILKKGCNGFIQKPFDIKQLSEKVRQLLGN